MDRTIHRDGRAWRVCVAPAQVGGGSESGLDLVFTEVVPHGRKLVGPVGRELMRSLSRHALDVDESLLLGALESALRTQRAQAGPTPPGGSDAA